MDLLARTAALIDVASVSYEEANLVDQLERELAALPWLSVDRVGDNLVARTHLGRSTRVLLGGHSDTVPPNGNESARLDGDVLWGLGAADMKGGLAVMLELARAIEEPAVDVTYLVYAREEVALADNGLREVFARAPGLLEADVALVGEPTLGVLEAGCQGTLRAVVTLRGARAHTARPWMGRNAIHRLGRLLEALDAYVARRPIVDGLEFREAVQAVAVDGGVAGNVVPDEAQLTIGHRFAPDRNAATAEAHLRELIDPHLEDGDRVDVVDTAPAAAPGLEHPVMAALASRNGLEVRAKLGWTDVAFFAERGIPAANFGPGDPLLAHTAEERVEGRHLESVYRALADLLENGA